MRFENLEIPDLLWFDTVVEEDGSALHLVQSALRFRVEEERHHVLNT